jgi:uncharacterized membrane protein
LPWWESLASWWHEPWAADGTSRAAPDPPAESPAIREAKDALKMRYAHDEISREEYLQGKVELDD